MFKRISNKENLKEPLRYNFSSITLANVRGMKKTSVGESINLYNHFRKQCSIILQCLIFTCPLI